MIQKRPAISAVYIVIVMVTCAPSSIPTSRPKKIARKHCQQGYDRISDPQLSQIALPGLICNVCMTTSLMSCILIVILAFSTFDCTHLFEIHFD